MQKIALNKKTIAKLCLPFLLSLILIIILYFIFDSHTFYFVVSGMFLYFVPFIGKEGVIPIAIANGISPILIASVIAFVEIMVGLFLMWNFDYAKLIPIIGKFINKCEIKGRELLAKKKFLVNFAFLGVVFFAGVPIHGNGATTSTVFGRLLGLTSLKTFIGVIIGAIVGNLFIAYFSELIISFAKIYLSSLTIVVIVIIILVILYILKRKGNIF